MFLVLVQTSSGTDIFRTHPSAAIVDTSRSKHMERIIFEGPAALGLLSSVA